MAQQLYHHLVHYELTEWLISLYNYSESVHDHTKKQNNQDISDWNKSFAKFNLLFPSSQQALAEQECILDIIWNYNLIIDNNYYEKVSLIQAVSSKQANCLAFHLNLLFNPLMAMKIDDRMCLHDFRANFSYPNIQQYNFPKFIGLLNGGDDLLAVSSSDSILNLFTNQQSLPQYIETVFNVWNEQKENKKRSYSAYSWAPLERKINILMNNGDEDERTMSIPEPPMVEGNDTDSLREKTWRIHKLEDGTIECFLSSDESIMQVDYFCKVLEKYIPSLESNAIYQSLLSDPIYQNAKIEEWRKKICENIPIINNDSDWYSIMAHLASYCFGECSSSLENVLKQLDYFRYRIFHSNHNDISIVEITPEIVDNVFSHEEQEYLGVLLVEMNNILQSNNIGKCSVNLTNWMTIALLYDIYRAEQAVFLKLGLLEGIYENLREKIPTISEHQIPFTFSPTFSLLFLATKSYSNNSIISIPTVSEAHLTRKILKLTQPHYNILKECKSNNGDPLIRGAKIDWLLCHIIDNYCRSSDFSLDRKEIQAIVQNLYHKSIEEILFENQDRDLNFDFLCSLLILVVKDRLNMKALTSLPKFTTKLPFIYSHFLSYPFQTTLCHPILLNRNSVKLSFWYPLLINSKTNTKMIVTINNQLEKKKPKITFTTLCYDRFTSIRVTLEEKIFLINFLLKNRTNKNQTTQEQIKQLENLIIEIKDLKNSEP